MRTNIVGTNCACVTRSRSISLRHRRESNFAMTTTVAPRRCIDMEETNGAAW
jgi:hypothetical protein